MTQDILALGMQADEVRRRLLGARATYQRVHLIGEPGSDDVPAAASEVRLMHLPATLANALAAVRRMREAVGTRLLSVFSYTQLAARARDGWGSLPELLSQLRAAGADSLAEISADEIDDLAAALATVHAAGLRPERVTVARAAGDDASRLIERVAHAGAHGFRRFAPLPRVLQTEKPTTGYEDVRTVARARLALADARNDHGPVSIEVDWTLYGPKLAQVALMFGADHLDAVSPTSDPTLGPRRATVEDVERNIRAAGLEPQEYHPVA